MSRPTALRTAGRRLAGVAFLLVPVLLIWLSVAIYDKRFSEVTTVTLRTSAAGHEMHRNADVKVRGVVVGEVRTITADGAGARLRLALDPRQARLIPSDVSARLLPTTVFGARYVSLIPPAGSSARPLADGSVISEDHSRNAVELAEVLKNTMRLLTAVQPAKLSATLTAMAQALRGRGARLGDNLVRLDDYLTKLNPHVPALTRNLAELAEFARNYDEAAPDLLQALTDFTVTSRTIADQRANLAELYATMTAAAGDLTEFLRANSGNIISLAATSRSTLELLAKHAPAFPCTLKTLAELVPKMDRVLGKGTDRPGVQVSVHSMQQKGRYLPGKDRPVYGAKGGPRCYSLPYRPGGGTAPKAAPAGPHGPVAVTYGGLGVANSGAENELINELLAPGLNEVPQALPDWSSVLVGPIYRDAEVKVG